ncbi:MAG: AtpZ/AtpI family protein [Defluviitaleaceae bacterium]|nr:AtpZ/AtpI family protein [Defluviitaleaceae bacterium]
MSVRKDKEKLKPGERNEIMSALGLFTHIGLTMVICIIGCIFIGIFLDNLLDTGSLFMFIFIVLGVASAFWSAYKIIIKSMK